MKGLLVLGAEGLKLLFGGMVIIALPAGAPGLIPMGGFNCAVASYVRKVTSSFDVRMRLVLRYLNTKFEKKQIGNGANGCWAWEPCSGCTRLSTRSSGCCTCCGGDGGGWQW